MALLRTYSVFSTCTASHLGWFNVQCCSSITPEHLVNFAKLYDYYVNRFKDGSSTHTAYVHLSNVTPASSTPAIYSAPSLMDLLNTNSIEPQEPQDMEAMEELWFNNTDPYDLAEIDCLNPDLQETVIQSSTQFKIANYVKLDDGKC